MQIKGLIYTVNTYKKIITIKYRTKLKIFYFQNNLWKRFRKYLYEGNVIDLVSLDNESLHNKIYAYQVLYVLNIEWITDYGNKILYNKRQINILLKDFFKSLNYKLFIDTEMTMPDYKKNIDFYPELIQAGFFLVNKNNEIVEEYNMHIRTKGNKPLNSRTKKFLHLDQKEFDSEALSYYKFYNTFKNLLNKYKPAVITFGKNDKLFLESSYKVNQLPSLKFITRYVNLSQIIKNYYELRDDPGLFNLYEKYYGSDLSQSHDAKEDAYITFKVYEAFVNELNLKR